MSKLEAFLNGLQDQGRSSPSDWQQFYLFLKSKKSANQPNPPVPLILAASGESDANKHRRLAEQLQWAVDNNCLYDAIRYLEDIPAEQWNKSSREQWNQDSYMRS